MWIGVTTLNNHLTYLTITTYGDTMETLNTDPLRLMLDNIDNDNWKAVFPKKRKEPTWKDWAQLIKEQIGVQRVSLKRFNEFIADSYLFVNEEGYLRLSESLTDEPTVESKPVITDEYEPMGECRGGPAMLECGHNDWYQSEDHEKAIEKGFCCAGQMHKDITFWHIRGLKHSIPEKLRRGGNENFPEQGLCAHPETGLYIGGFANCCTYNKDKVRCVYHKK